MKNAILYPMISVLAFGISGTGTYLLRGLLNRKVPTTNDSTKAESSNTSSSDDFELDGFSKMINKITSTKETKVQNANFSIYLPGTDVINLTLKNADVDLTALLDGKADQLQMNGRLQVEYSSINEEVGFYFEDQYLYIDYGTKYFTFDAPKSIEGILPILNKLGIDVPELTTSSMDMSTILDSALSILEGVAEEATANGYEYTIHCDDFIADLDLPVSVTGVDIVLEADSEYNFIGGRTAGDGILIDNQYRIQLDFDGIQTISETAYTGLDSASKGRYQNLTNSNTEICTTIADLMDKKNFVADYSISYEAVDNTIQKQDFNGTIKGDLSTIESDVSKGVYEVTIDHSSMGVKLNSFYGLYRENSIYLTVNNLIKGKISNSTIEDLIPMISKETGSIDMDGVTDEIYKILEGTDFDKILSGDLSVYKNFINDFDYTSSDGYILKINAKAFGLGDYILTLKLKSTTDDVSNGFKLSILDLRYLNHKVSVELDVSPVANVSLAYSDDELDQFKDYKGVTSIFNTISDIVDKKKFSTSYSFMVTDSSKNSRSGSGKISADFSTLSGESEYYGDYGLTLDTAINGYNHSVCASYQDHDLYLKLDDFFQQKISDTEIGAIMSVIEENSDTDSDVFDSINETLEYFKSSDGLMQDLFGECKSTYSLVSLESILSVDKSNTDPDKLVVELNIPYVFRNTAFKDDIGGMTLEIDTNEKRILSISVSDLEIKSKYTIDFTIDLDEQFENFMVKEEDKAKYTEINNASKMLSGFYALPTDMEKFSVNLDGSIRKDGDTSDLGLLTMFGDAEVDIATKESPIVGGTLNLIQPKTEDYDYVTDHQIVFNYSGNHDDGRTKAEYTSIDYKSGTEDYRDLSNLSDRSTAMGLLMDNTDIFHIYDQVTELGTERTDNLLYQYLQEYFDKAAKVSTGVPLMDAIENKDYSSLLNDYIKKVEIRDNEIELVVSTSLLDSSDTSGKTDTIVVGFDSDYKIKTATIDGNYGEYEIHAEISLGEYSEEMIPSMTLDSSSYVDVHGFDILLSCLITTTEHHYFKIDGDLDVPIKLGSWKIESLKTYFTAEITVIDKTVNAYLSFNNTGTSYNINTKGFYGVEFFVENEEIVTERTKTSTKNKPTVEIRKLTADEMMANLPYYLLSYILNIESVTLLFGSVKIGNIVLNEIYSAMESESSDSSTTMTRKYNSLIKSAVCTTKEDGSGIFDLALDIGSLISVSMIDFGDTNVQIGYDQYGEISSMSLNMDLKAVSIITIQVKFNATRSYGTIDNENKNIDACLTRYDKFMTALGDRMNDMPYYVIESIKAASSSSNGIVVTDNASEAVLNLSYSEDNRLLFFGQN